MTSGYLPTGWERMTEHSSTYVHHGLGIGVYQTFEATWRVYQIGPDDNRGDTGTFYPHEFIAMLTWAELWADQCAEVDADCVPTSTPDECSGA